MIYYAFISNELPNVTQEECLIKNEDMSLFFYHVLIVFFLASYNHFLLIVTHKVLVLPIKLQYNDPYYKAPL